MRQTAGAIKILVRRYKSVLKKCFLINMGVFTLGLVGTAANAAPVINIDPDELSTQDSTTFEQSGSSAADFVFDNSEKTGSGTIEVKIPDDADTSQSDIQYYTYNYAVPGGYTQSNRVSAVSSDLTNKYFYAISNGGNGGAIANSKKNAANITADFIQNHITSGFGGGAISNDGTLGTVTGMFIGNHASVSGDVYGGAIRSKAGSIGGFVADFIGNHTSSSGSSAYGGVANNDVTIGSFTGNFIGNYAQGAKGAYGGVIRNKGTINSITGNFVSNHATATNSNVNAHGGAIFNAGTLGNIKGDFIDNYTSGTNQSFGGAIYNSKTITSLEGDFVGNRTSSAKNSAGGAIYNYKDGTNDNAIDSIKGNFIGNSAVTEASSTSYSARGGAIYNTGTVTAITNADFSKNFAQSAGAVAQGGAIYTTVDMTLTADGSVAANNGVSTISGNWVSSDGGVTRNYEAIYVDNSEATFTFEANNNGEFVIDDYINGANGYNVHFTGDGTGTINLYNDVKQGDVTVDAVTMNLADDNYKNYTMKSLNTVNTAKWVIDFDAANKKADTITTTGLSSGVISLDSNDLITGDFTGWNESTKVQIINNGNQNSTLKVALSATPEIDLGIVAYSVTYDEVQSQNNWETGIYGKYVRINGTAHGKLGLATTNTADDSIGIADYYIDGGEVTYNVGDTLAAVNQSTLATRSFDAVSEGQTYTVTEDLGVAGAGEFTVNGISGNETIALGSYKGFELDNATTLNLNNVKITGSNGVIFSTTNAAVVNMNNTYIDGDITGAKVNIVGANTIDGTVTGSLLSIAVDTEAQIKGSSLFTENVSAGVAGAVYNRGTLTIGGTDDDDIEFISNGASHGGAVYNLADATISGVNFESNTADTSGGALYNNGANAKLTVEGKTSFEGNRAINRFGGAISNISGTVTVTGTTEDKILFKQNSVDTYYGGAIYNSGGNVGLSNVDFQQNSAGERGGAIYNTGENAELTIDGASSFSDNSTGSYGGAIGNSSGKVTITGTEDSSVTFTSNKALIGGALINLGGTVKIDYAKFENNEADSDSAGGGAIAQFNEDSSLDIDHSTFVGNKTINDGGIGGAIEMQKGTLDLKNSAFTSNTATTGGAIYNENGAGAMSIDNVEFTDNEGATGGGAVGVFARNVTSEIKNSKFTGNKTLIGSDVNARWGNGGAINIGSEGKLKITDSEFKDNTAEAKGGAIATRTKLDTQRDTRLEVENSVFENNTAVEWGGAIYSNASYDDLGTTIKNSTFKNNSAAIGGAVYNDHINGLNGATEYIAYMSISDSSFDGNSATEKGGALFNDGTINEITNVKFTNNSVVSDTSAAGGAIYTNNSITITTDGESGEGVSEFKGNYIQVGNGEKEYQAIYINGADKSLTFETNNQGKVNMYDGIDGTSGYDTHLTGDSTGTINLYNNIANSDVTIDNVNIDTADGTLHDYEFLSLTSDAGVKWAIDFDVKGKAADTFATDGENPISGGVVTLDKLNLTDGEYTDVSGPDFKVQILKTQGSAEAADLQLALSDELRAELEAGYVVAVIEDTSVTPVGLNTKWSDEFKETGTVTTKTDKLGLATTATLNDSIAVISEETTEETVDRKLDALKTVNTDTANAVKNFDATENGEVYVVSDDVGATKGSVIVSGIAGGQEETIDFDGHEGFAISAGTEVSLKDVTVKNAVALATVAEGAVLNLHNVKSISNGTLFNEGTINISGNNDITDNINGKTGKGVIEVNSDWQMKNTIDNNTVNVNQAKLTLNGSNLTANDVLNVGNGSTIDIGANKINLKSVSFDTGSNLALHIDGLQSGKHGEIVADEMITINTGAKLTATLAQGVGEGDVTLLSAPAHSGDFADDDISHFEDGVNVIDNNMYKFEKKPGVFGVYTISQISTAEDVVIDAGGDGWVGDAAGAWVDGSTFEEGSVSADVADKLAALAQTDGKELIKQIKALAPTETGVVQAETSEKANRLFKVMDAYLRGERSPMGFASGDSLEDVNIWGKVYIGESKISNRGTIRGSDGNSRGVVIGIEKGIEQSKIGAGFQYDVTDVKAYSRKIDGPSLLGFAYGEYKPSRWFVNGVASYGRSEYTEKKYALNSEYKAKYNTYIGSIAAMTGYQFDWYTPEIGMRYYHIKNAGYTDAAGQSIERDMADILRGVAGIRFAHDFGAWRPDIYLGLTYDFAADKGNTTVNLANGTSYTVPGKRLKRLGYEAGASLSGRISDNITASIQYLGAYRKDYREHTGLLNLKYEF